MQFMKPLEKVCKLLSYHLKSQQDREKELVENKVKLARSKYNTAISLLEQEVLKKNTEVIVLKEKIETINQNIEEQKMSLDIDVQSLLNKRTEKLNLELKLEELTEEYKYALSSKEWLEEIVTEIFN